MANKMSEANVLSAFEELARIIGDREGVKLTVVSLKKEGGEELCEKKRRSERSA